MARIKPAPGFENLRGTFGNVVIYKRGDKTYARSLPKKPGEIDIMELFARARERRAADLEGDAGRKLPGEERSTNERE